MKIALIGATGFVGTPLLDEAVERGHNVTAIARNIEDIRLNKHITPVQIDINAEKDKLVQTLKGHDVVISSVHFTDFDQDQIIQAVKEAEVPRYLVVGGAGGLEVSPGLTLLETDDFPKEFKQEAKAGVEFLNKLKQEKHLKWTFLSPSANFKEGEKTGHFRLGGKKLLRNEKGKSEINLGDYAVAMLNEAEKPKHIQQRFTVGY